MKQLNLNQEIKELRTQKTRRGGGRGSEKQLGGSVSDGGCPKAHPPLPARQRDKTRAHDTGSQGRAERLDQGGMGEWRLEGTVSDPALFSGLCLTCISLVIWLSNQFQENDLSDSAQT